MKSHIYGATTLNPSTTAVNYNWITSTNLAAWNATQTNRDTVIPHALTLDQLRIKVATAPGAGKSYAYTVMKNGTATALTCTVSDTNTSAQDLANSVSFAAGDTISIRATPTGTPTVPSGTYWSIRQDATSLFAVIGGASQNAANTGNNYNGLMSTAGWGATEATMSSPMPTSGALKNLYIMSSAAPGASTDRTFTIMVNGVASGVTCSLGAAGTTANDTTHSVSVSAGDTVSIQSSVTGTPAVANIAWACSFQPTTDGESFLLYADSAIPSTTATNYEQPLGRASNAWGAAETVKDIMLAATTIKALYVLISPAPGSAKSYTFTARKNATGTSATAAVTDLNTTANITGQSVSITDDDKLSLESVPAGTPASTSVKAGLLLYIAPSGGVTATPSTTALTTTTFAPTIQLPKLVTAGVVALALTTFAPTVVVNQTVTPGVKALAITTFAPVVTATNNITVTPSTVALTTSTFAPTIVLPKTVTPGVATLTISTFAPTVTATSGTVVTPSTTSLSLTAFAPTVVTPVAVTPGVASLAISTFAPTILLPRTVTPATAALTLSTFAPTVTAPAHVSVTPGTLALVLSTLAPSVTRTVGPDASITIDAVFSDPSIQLAFGIPSVTAMFSDPSVGAQFSRPQLTATYSNPTIQAEFSDPHITASAI